MKKQINDHSQLVSDPIMIALGEHKLIEVNYPDQKKQKTVVADDKRIELNLNFFNMISHLPEGFQIIFIPTPTTSFILHIQRLIVIFDNVDIDLILRNQGFSGLIKNIESSTKQEKDNVILKLIITSIIYLIWVKSPDDIELADLIRKKIETWIDYYAGCDDFDKIFLLEIISGLGSSLKNFSPIYIKNIKNLYKRLTEKYQQEDIKLSDKKPENQILLDYSNVSLMKNQKIKTKKSMVVDSKKITTVYLEFSPFNFKRELKEKEKKDIKKIEKNLREITKEKVLSSQLDIGKLMALSEKRLDLIKVYMFQRLWTQALDEIQEEEEIYNLYELLFPSLRQISGLEDFNQGRFYKIHILTKLRSAECTFSLAVAELDELALQWNDEKKLGSFDKTTQEKCLNIQRQLIKSQGIYFSVIKDLAHFYENVSSIISIKNTIRELRIKMIDLYNLIYKINNKYYAADLEELNSLRFISEINNEYDASNELSEFVEPSVRFDAKNLCFPEYLDNDQQESDKKYEKDKKVVKQASALSKKIISLLFKINYSCLDPIELANCHFDMGLLFFERSRTKRNLENLPEEYEKVDPTVDLVSCVFYLGKAVNQYFCYIDLALKEEHQAIFMQCVSVKLIQEISYYLNSQNYFIHYFLVKNLLRSINLIEESKNSLFESEKKFSAEIKSGLLTRADALNKKILQFNDQELHCVDKKSIEYGLLLMNYSVFFVQTYRVDYLKKAISMVLSSNGILEQNVNNQETPIKLFLLQNTLVLLQTYLLLSMNSEIDFESQRKYYQLAVKNFSVKELKQLDPESILIKQIDNFEISMGIAKQWHCVEKNYHSLRNIYLTQYDLLNIIVENNLLECLNFSAVEAINDPLQEKQIHEELKTIQTMMIPVVEASSTNSYDLLMILAMKCRQAYLFMRLSDFQRASQINIEIDRLTEIIRKCPHYFTSFEALVFRIGLMTYLRQTQCYFLIGYEKEALQNYQCAIDFSEKYGELYIDTTSLIRKIGEVENYRRDIKVPQDKLNDLNAIFKLSSITFSQETKKTETKTKKPEDFEKYFHSLKPVDKIDNKKSKKIKNEKKPILVKKKKKQKKVAFAPLSNKKRFSVKESSNSEEKVVSAESSTFSPTAYFLSRNSASNEIPLEDLGNEFVTVVNRRQRKKEQKSKKSFKKLGGCADKNHPLTKIKKEMTTKIICPKVSTPVEKSSEIKLKEFSLPTIVKQIEETGQVAAPLKISLVPIQVTNQTSKKGVEEKLLTKNQAVASIDLPIKVQAEAKTQIESKIIYEWKKSDYKVIYPPPVAEFLKDLENKCFELGMEPIIFRDHVVVKGGAIRDHVLGEIPKDYDVFMFMGNQNGSRSIKILQEWLKNPAQFAAYQNPYLKGLFTFTLSNYKFDVVFLEDKINFCPADFMVNMFMADKDGYLIFPVNIPKRRFKAVSEAIEYLKEKVVETVEDSIMSFNNDPLRMLRSIHLNMRGFKISSEVTTSITRCARLLERIEGALEGRIIAEIGKWWNLHQQLWVIDNSQDFIPLFPFLFPKLSLDQARVLLQIGINLQTLFQIYQKGCRITVIAGGYFLDVIDVKKFLARPQNVLNLINLHFQEIGYTESFVSALHEVPLDLFSESQLQQYGYAIFVELAKLFLRGYAQFSFHFLTQFKVFNKIFYYLGQCIEKDEALYLYLINFLKNLDVQRHFGSLVPYKRILFSKILAFEILAYSEIKQVSVENSGEYLLNHRYKTFLDPIKSDSSHLIQESKSFQSIFMHGKRVLLLESPVFQGRKIGNPTCFNLASSQDSQAGDTLILKSASQESVSLGENHFTLLTSQDENVRQHTRKKESIKMEVTKQELSMLKNNF